MFRRIFTVVGLFLIGHPIALAEQVWQTSAGLGAKHHFLSSGWFFQLPLEVGTKLRFIPGLGPRFSYFGATNRTYQTAGTKDRQEKPIEKLKIDGTQHGSLNGAVSIIGEYLPWKVFIGFNIDAFGYTFAPQKKFGGTSLDGGGVNLLRYAYNDLGTLHSETFIGMNFPERSLQFRMGTTHSVTQYKAKSSIPGISGNRFLNFSDTVFMGIGILF